MDATRLKAAIDEVKTWAAPLHGGKDTHVMGSLDVVVTAASNMLKVLDHGYAEDVERALRHPQLGRAAKAEAQEPVGEAIGTAGSLALNSGPLTSGGQDADSTAAAPVPAIGSGVEQAPTSGVEQSANAGTGQQPDSEVKPADIGSAG